MSDDATLDEFTEDNTESSIDWETVKLEKIVEKRAENVDPQQLDVDKHVGLEHIQPNSPVPSWESVEGLASTKRRFQAGDILFAKLRPNLEKSAQPDFDGIASTDIFPIIAADGVNSKYLLYRLSSKPAYDHARRTSVGTRMPRTSWNLFTNFEFDLPSLSEQRKIATILQTVDQAIQNTEEIIKQKQRLRQAVAQESLVIETNSYTRPTEWGETPDLWAEKPLSDVCELITDGTHMPPERTDDGIPLVGVDEIAGVQLDFTGGLSYISEEDYKQMSDSNKPNPEDVLIAVVGATIGKSALVTRQKPFAIQRSLGLLRPNDSVLPKFLHTVVQSPNFKRQLNTRSRATAQAGVYLEELKHVQIPVPSLKEQKEIANRVDTITASIRCENRLSNRLRVLKQGLMQDLLSGEVRTTDVEIDIPEEVAKHG